MEEKREKTLQRMAVRNVQQEKRARSGREENWIQRCLLQQLQWQQSYSISEEQEDKIGLGNVWR